MGDGVEVDVDVVFSGGEWRYAAVTDNGPTMEPYFNETWGVCPSLLPSSQQRALRELATDAVKCLGLENGVFHVECKMTSHGPHLIEVNARMGGGPVHETNFRVWGVDLVEETLFATVGIPSRPHTPGERRPPRHGAARCRTWISSLPCKAWTACSMRSPSYQLAPRLWARRTVCPHG